MIGDNDILWAFLIWLITGMMVGHVIGFAIWGDHAKTFKRGWQAGIEYERERRKKEPF
jgi:hypothetical protein